MTIRLDTHADESTARWLCPGCGRTYELNGPAFPRCASCGAQCRFLDADGLPFVSSPEERLERAMDAHEEAYATWRHWLWLVEVREAHSSWLGAVAARVNRAAEHVDFCRAELERLRG